jgi:hypothetical protein
LKIITYQAGVTEMIALETGGWYFMIPIYEMAAMGMITWI